MTQNDSRPRQSGPSPLEAVIQSIEGCAASGEEWDTSYSSAQTFLYILRSAHNVRASQPFTSDQKSLNAYLTARLAGRRLCDFAWREFTHSL